MKKDLPRFPPAAWTDYSLRAPSLILTGCGLGIAGALLYQQSFPPPAGSPEEKLADTERELARTRIEPAAAAAAPQARSPYPAKKVTSLPTGP